MSEFAGYRDRATIEGEAPWSEREVPPTIWRQISQTAEAYPDRPAVSFQLFSGPKDPAETLSWRDLQGQVAQFANAMRRLGLGPEDRVAYILPNSNETAITYFGGMVAGIVTPINPLLDTPQLAAILRESGAKVVVTLRAFPRSDIAQKAHAAVAEAPDVEHVVEVDLRRYLTGLKKLAIPFVRPKTEVTHKARIHNFAKLLRGEPTDLSFEEATADRICANFHTGGTTGMPKVAQHTASGVLYNGWIARKLLFRETDAIMCPLPLFHVFAAVVIMGSSLCSGAHVVMPTPAGYRGDGVFDNFWKLCERWGITFMITVPTAISTLMQRKVDADISALRLAFSGSAPLPVELYRRFEKAAGVTICEGYGLTEATCLVSINPPDGEKKIGSVGIPFPYTEVRIFHEIGEGFEECPRDVVGEICVSSPGVEPGRTYTDPAKNEGLYVQGRYLRTGDLGRLDNDGYLWITGRAKDLIIRGGHNIDPAMIEQALSGHDQVAFVGAVGQPDAHAGEMPCAYVELCEGGRVEAEDLRSYAREHIHERAAWPKHVEILPELPKTAVGKVFKPDLRRRAIARVYGNTLTEAGLAAEVTRVTEDRRRGLVARIRRTGPVDEAAVSRVLGDHTLPWEWEEDAAG